MACRNKKQIYSIDKKIFSKSEDQAPSVWELFKNLDGKGLVGYFSELGTEARALFFNKKQRAENFASAFGEDGDRLLSTIYATRGAAEVARSPLLASTRVYDPAIGDYRSTGRGLKHILSETDSEIVYDLSRFMASERQLELSRKAREEGKEVEIDPENDVLAADTIEALRAKGDSHIALLKDLSGEIRGFSKRAILDPLRAHGFLSEEQYASILGSSDFYAPLFKVVKEFEASNPITEEVSRFTAEGRGSQAQPIKNISRDISEGILDPLEAIIAKVQEIGMWQVRQAMFNELGDLAFSDQAKAESMGVRLKGKDFPGRQRAENEFVHMRDGTRTVFEVDSDMQRALGLLTPSQYNWLQKGLNAIGRVTAVQRAGAVLSLGFGVRGALRAEFQGLTYDENYRLGANFVRGLISTSPGLANMAKKLPGVSEQYIDRLLDQGEQYLASGAAIADIISDDIRNPDVTLRELTPAKTAKEKAKKAANRLKKQPLLPLQALAQKFELSPRAGIFGRGQDLELSQKDLVSGSRDTLIDFGRKGEIGQLLNQAYVFLNAEFQDVDLFFRKMADPKTRGKTLTKGFMAITVPAIANYALNKDDEEYWNLPLWERSIFYHIKSSDGFIRIPRPVGVLNLVFGLAPEAMLKGMDKVDRDSASVLIEQVVEQTPAHYLHASEKDSALSPNQLADTVPSFAKPFVEMMANYDFFRERPLVPISEQGRSPATQGLDRGPVTRGVAEATGNPPQFVEKAAEGFGSTLGRSALELANRAAGQPSRVEDKFSLQDLIGLKGAKSVGYSSQPVQDFYRLRERTREAMNDFNAYKQAGNKVAAHRVAQENPYIVGCITRGGNCPLKVMDNLAINFGLVSDALRSVRDSDMPRGEKLAKIYELEHMMTLSAANILDELEEPRR